MFSETVPMDIRLPGLPRLHWQYARLSIWEV